MNEVTNALVSLQVCPGSYGKKVCCQRCSYKDAGIDKCQDALFDDCMRVLNMHFGRPVDTSPDYTTQISYILREIGIPASKPGYAYIHKTLHMTMDDVSYLKSITKRLYPDLAKAFDTTPPGIERGIRVGIETAWDRGDLKVLERYFGNTVSFKKTRPTNAEFIATLTYHLRQVNGMDPFN